MTNFEKLRAMTDEELINFLANLVDTSDLIPEYCDERCPYSEECEEYDGMECMMTDEEIVEDWGMKEV